jgi:hypothetical protein
MVLSSPVANDCHGGGPLPGHPDGWPSRAERQSGGSPRVAPDPQTIGRRPRPSARPPQRSRGGRRQVPRPANKVGESIRIVSSVVTLCGGDRVAGPFRLGLGLRGASCRPDRLGGVRGLARMLGRSLPRRLARARGHRPCGSRFAGPSPAAAAKWKATSLLAARRLGRERWSLRPPFVGICRRLADRSWARPSGDGVRRTPEARPSGYSISDVRGRELRRCSGGDAGIATIVRSNWPLRPPPA